MRKFRFERIKAVAIFVTLQFLQFASSLQNETSEAPAMSAGTTKHNWQATDPRNPQITLKLRSGINETPNSEFREESRFVGKIFKKQTWDSITTVKPVIYRNKGYMSNDIDAVLEDPPPHEDVAKMARYIVSHSDWTSVATISSRSPTTGSPFANVFSVSDGTIGNSSGVPYLYITPLDLSVRDLQKDSRASLTMSLAQGAYCAKHNYDPEDPRCAHVILTGRIVKVSAGSEEARFAQESLFSRHSEMADWPKDHGFFFAKLNISNIMVLDYFGGAQTVTTEDYFSSEAPTFDS